MRIVAGKHRGRRLQAPKGRRLRPTAERAREAVFNILIHRGLTRTGASPLPGARVLDPFAGTGAFGLEALSRGAGHAVFMDTDREALRAVARNAERLGEQDHVTIVEADVTRPPTARAPCGIVFLDAPYGSGLGTRALAALGVQGWLTADAIAAVEMAVAEPFEAPEGFEIRTERTYGRARVVLLRRVG